MYNNFKKIFLLFILIGFPIMSAYPAYYIRTWNYSNYPINITTQPQQGSVGPYKGSPTYMPPNSYSEGYVTYQILAEDNVAYGKIFYTSSETASQCIINYSFGADSSHPNTLTPSYTGGITCAIWDYTSSEAHMHICNANVTDCRNHPTGS